MFGWWGFNLWLPAYLSMPASEGGIGLGPRSMSVLVIFMQVGMWLGYITFGFISDRLGRKRSYVGFLVAAAAFMLLYSQARQPLILFALGPFVAFFGTGYFTGFGALTAEIYPTSVRATAQGFTYNAGRIVCAAAPLAVGSLAGTTGVPLRVRGHRRGLSRRPQRFGSAFPKRRAGRSSDAEGAGPRTGPSSPGG